MNAANDAIQLGVDLMPGADGYYLRPWVLSPGQADPDRGDVVGPIPSKQDADDLQSGMLARMKALVERSARDAAVRAHNAKPARELRPGEEAKPFQWNED